MDNAGQMNLIQVALQTYARNARRVNMLRIVDELVEIFVQEGYRFGDIIEAFADYAESERAKTEQQGKEDQQFAWTTVTALLKSAAQEARSENLP